MLTVVSGWLMPLALGMSPRGKWTQCVDGGHPGTHPHADGLFLESEILEQKHRHTVRLIKMEFIHSKAII